LGNNCLAVGAATETASLRSRRQIARCWKASSGKSNTNAGVGISVLKFPTSQ
jgi:hypothetical protein